MSYIERHGWKYYFPGVGYFSFWKVWWWKIAALPLWFFHYYSNYELLNGETLWNNYRHVWKQVVRK